MTIKKPHKESEAEYFKTLVSWLNPQRIYLNCLSVSDRLSTVLQACNTVA